MTHNTTKQSIRQRMQELYVYDLYGFRLEVKELAQLIYPHEIINCFATGVYDGLRRMVVVTGYRVIVVGRRLVGQGEILSISRKDVTDFHYTKRLFASTISFTSDGQEYRFTGVSRRVVELFGWAMQQPIAQ